MKKQREVQALCRGMGAVPWDTGGVCSRTSPCLTACFDVPEQELPTSGSTWE